jgi:hypothetical protein
VLGGCLEFVAPELAGSRGGAVLQGAVRLLGNDSVRIEAHLTPGVDAAKTDFRVVSPDTLYVNDQVVPSSGVLANQERDYIATVATDTATLRRTGIVIRSPGVSGVVAPPPVFRFPSIQRVGSDTVPFTRGEDVRLPIRVLRPAGLASNIAQDWRVELVSADQVFRLGGNGQPPESILLPAAYVPSSGANVQATLFFSEILQQRVPPGDYVATLALDARVQWVLRPRVAPPPGTADLRPVAGDRGEMTAHRR